MIPLEGIQSVHDLQLHPTNRGSSCQMCTRNLMDVHPLEPDNEIDVLPQKGKIPGLFNQELSWHPLQ